jgi:hypothetical protein
MGPSFSTRDRRDRLVVRHRLGGRRRGRRGTPASAADLAGELVGLHASDPATPFLSAWARLEGFEANHLEAALYDHRLAVKHLGMRRTLFVHAAEVVPTVHGACTAAIAARERRRLAVEVTRGGLADDGGHWVDRAVAATWARLEVAGPSTGAELSRSVPELQAKLTYGEGRAWGGEVGVAGRVLSIMAAEGRIRRGRPAGGWTSSQHRWQLAEASAASTDAVAEASVATTDAVADLARRWLVAFGPATVEDLTWWTGLGATRVRRALGCLEVIECDLDGATGVVLADDTSRGPNLEPAAALLPALDPTVMGWKHRRWYLGEHAGRLFDRNGNGGPTIWWDGRIVGGWAQRPSGEVAVAVLDDIGVEGRAAVEAEADALQAWLGEIVVSPRFPTPLERRLRA